MILSFADTTTEEIWRRRRVRSISLELQQRTQVKLVVLNAAADLRDLTCPPGNRLEPLKGDRKGQHSIRVNDQWRICFRWTHGGPEGVELVDYH